MSSISGLGSSALLQYLQGAKGKQKASKSAATTLANIIGDSDGDSDGSSQGILGAQQGQSGSGSFFQQIQSAVSSALQSAQSSGPTTNPNQVIQNAIAQILQNQRNITNGLSGSDPDGDTDTQGVADQDGSTIQSVFAQLLQSNGVNPQQFQQDFLTAIQSAQNGGSPNAPGALSSLPTGSLVDVLA